MTTVVYANGILAADKRTTHGHSGEQECPDCGSKENKVNDSSTKIQRPSSKQEVKFRDEKLIAVARAGRVPVTRVLCRLILDGKDVEDYVHATAGLQNTPCHEKVFATLLILTEKNLYRLEYDTGKIKIEERGLKKPTAIGNGKKAAYFAIKLFEMGAVDAIRAATFADRGTGGGIDWIDTSETEAKFHHDPIGDQISFLGEIATKLNNRGIQPWLPATIKDEAPVKKAVTTKKKSTKTTKVKEVK